MTMPIGELTLDQMLADPIVHLVMRRDGVTEAQIRDLMAQVGDTRLKLGGQYQVLLAAA